MSSPDINDTLREEGPEGVRKRHDGAHGKQLAKTHAAFRKWLDENFDLDVIDAVLATAASEQLTGDALWLLFVSGSAFGKTEVVRSLEGASAHVTSTIASEGALLSATPAARRLRGQPAACCARSASAASSSSRT